MLFTLLLSLIVPAGSASADMRFNFENCYKLKEEEHMLSPELKKLLNDLQAGEPNIRINREKIRIELEALDNTPYIMRHSLSMSPRVCPTCGREL